MLEEKLQLVITFHTTTAAMHMDKCCKEHQLPGKLSSIPDQLTAGCGFAWIAEITDKELLEKAIVNLNIVSDRFCEINI